MTNIILFLLLLFALLYLRVKSSIFIIVFLSGLVILFIGEELSTIFLAFLSGFALLFVGGELLVKGASGIAKKKNIPSHIIGITLVALSTSAPELFFNIISATRGNTEFALSNVAGSNLANICIGIGISSIISSLFIERKTFKKDLLFLCFSQSIILYFIIFSNPIGLNLFHGFILLTLFFFYLYLKRNDFKNNSKISDKDIDTNTSTTKELLIFFSGVLLLYIGGDIVFKNSTEAVSILNISESFVGLTIVALGTSIPDCAASIIAAKNNENGIAIGNILGSNIFNILLVLGCTIFVYQNTITYSSLITIDFIATLIISIALFTASIINEKIHRYFGLLLIVIYPTYLYFRITLLN